MQKIYQLLDALQFTGADNSQWYFVNVSAMFGTDFDEAEVLEHYFGKGRIADGSVVGARYFAVWENTDLYEYLSEHTFLCPSCSYIQEDGDVVFLYCI